MSVRNYLFVCARNRLRSPTAEHIFAEIEGIRTLSAGLNRDAEGRVSDELVDWADVIFVMERAHRSKLRTNHAGALKDKKIVVLGIPDDYDFMDPKLIDLLRKPMDDWLPS